MRRPDLNFREGKQRTGDDVQRRDFDLSTARTKPEEINIGGRFIYVAQEAYDDKYTLSGSKTVGKALITLNEPNGEAIELNAGVFYRVNTPFDRLFLRNTAQSNKMLRLIVTTETEIFPYSSDLSISDADTHTKLDTLETSLTALEALLVNDETLRKPLTTLAGASYASVSGSSSTVVTAGANTNGVIIRFAQVVNGGSGNCSLSIDGNVVIRCDGGSAGLQREQIRDIFVPAGQAVAIQSSVAAARVHILYEVL